MNSVAPTLRSAALAFCLATVLSACAGRYQGDVNSPYYVIPSGSRAILTQPITIPPEQVGVYIQNGKVLPWHEVNAYYTHCKFQVYKRKDTEQQVTPDDFLVKRVVQDQVQMLRWSPWQVAGMSLGMGVSMDGGPSLFTFANFMYLSSERQPHVWRLACGQWAYPGTMWAEYPSIAEMRKALGDLIKLDLPPTGNK